MHLARATVVTRTRPASPTASCRADGLTAPQRLTPAPPRGRTPVNTLAEPDLRVEEPARRLHVPVRHAYSLFARIGATSGAYIRELRLLAAQVMLSDPRYARLGISDIATVLGSSISGRSNEPSGGSTE